MKQEGRSYSQNSYRFGFNGMEQNEEIDYGNYDFGARMYDSRIGRWLSVDKFNFKYPSISPYTFALNNPTRVTDIGGDSIWIDWSSPVTRNSNGVLVKVNYINVTVSILDASSRNFTDSELNQMKYSVEEEIEQELKLRKNKRQPDPQTGVFEDGKEIWITNATIKVAKSMDDVAASDHLLVIVDDVTHNEPLGGIFGYTSGVANMNSKIAYAQAWPNYFSEVPIDNIISTLIHELGHTLGLSHTWEDGFNYEEEEENHMSYGDERKNFSSEQVQKIINDLIDEKLNKGKNYKITQEDKSERTKSTSSKPYKNAVKKGNKIPKPIND